MASTLRCHQDELPVDPDDTFRYRARAGVWHIQRETNNLRNFNGKAGQCARDMVAECRRCSKVVCRVSLLAPISLAGGGQLPRTNFFSKARFPRIRRYPPTPFPLGEEG